MSEKTPTPEDLIQSLTALLNRLTATAEAPDEFARRLLIDPLRKPKPKGAIERMKLVRSFLRSEAKRVYGLADEFPDAPWLAEINRDEGVVVLSQEAIYLMFKDKVTIDQGARDLGLQPRKDEVEPFSNEAINYWRKLGYYKTLPARTIVQDALIALDLRAVASSFDTF